MTKEHTSKRAANLVTLTPPWLTRSCKVAESAKKRRSARFHGSVTCCDFGPDRLIMFPDGEFCHPCKMWEDRDIVNRRLTRNMEKYRCRIMHPSLVEPKKKESTWYGFKNETKSEVITPTDATTNSEIITPTDALYTNQEVEVSPPRK